MGCKEDEYKEALQALREMFPGQLFLGPEDMAKALGLATRTIYNKMSQKTFPIPTNRAHGRVKAKIHDVARHYAAL